MPISIVVGGQFGSEGKGKVAHWFARELGATAVVRVGGSNSGHTVIDESGGSHVFRHLPTAAILPDVLCVLGAGSYIDPPVLFDEMARVGLPPDRLIIDPSAMVVADADRNAEDEWLLRNRIGSTASGTGAAVIRRIHRSPDTIFASAHPELKAFVMPTKALLANLLAKNARVLIEGTQGFGLSLLHSPHFPYVTSRDTTAAGFLAEVGLSPLEVDDIILVMRSNPIRVAGNSGPLPNETDWSTIAAQSGNDPNLCEHTSVTLQVRRVAQFDATIVNDAILANRPTKIVLNHIDHVDSESLIGRGLSLVAEGFLRSVESDISRPIDFIGAGPAHLVHRDRVDKASRKSADVHSLAGSA